MSTALPRSPLWLLARCLLPRRQARSALDPATAIWQASALQPEHLSRYCEQLGFAAGALPLSYHYLALQRAQLDWMLRPGFPHRLLGMVHLAQSFERLAAWEMGVGFELQLRAEPEGKRNLLLHTVLLQGGVVKLRASSLYRPPWKGAKRPMRERPSETRPTALPLAQWALPAAAGRAYAWLSGDANPIHLGRFSARAFGLPSPIIHGMHTLARCEAELTRLLGQAPQRLSIQFLRPLALPGWAQLHPSYEVWGPAGRCACLQVA